MVLIQGRPMPIAVRILGILTAMLVLVTGCGNNQSKDAVLLFGKDAISTEEYEMLALEYCNQVYMQYSTEQVNASDFWETEIDGIVPYTLLEDIIIGELKENYALKKLAVELGIVEDYTYQDLMNMTEEENELRSDTSGNEVFYGLTGFDASSYYSYWYSNLETRVTETLIKERIQISEEDCEEYYESHISDFSYEIGVSILYAEIPYTTYEELGLANQSAQQLVRMMEDTDSVEELAVDFPDVYIELLELNSLDTQEGMSGVYSDRWMLASQMAEDEIYGPYEQNGMVCVIKCIDRVENGQIPFSDMEGQIERYLQVQQAQEIIQQAMDDLKIEDGGKSTRDAIIEAVGR